MATRPQETGAAPDARFPAGLAGVPSWAPDELQLADLELLLSGALEPLTGFMDQEDAAHVARDGALASGSPFPFAVTLDVPGDALPADADALVLEDPEGAPLALLEITERIQAGPGERARIAGPVRALRVPEHGPFRRMRLSPAQVREKLGIGGDRPRDAVYPGAAALVPVTGTATGTPQPVLACVTRGPLHRRELGQLRRLAGGMRARLLLLPLVTGAPLLVARPEALVRTVLAALPQLPADALVVPVPLAARGAEGSREELLARGFIAAAYGATHLFIPAPVNGAADPARPLGAGVSTRDMIGADAAVATVPGVPIPVIIPAEWVFDTAAEVWRPAVRVEPAARRAGLSRAEITRLLDHGDEIPDWFTPAAVARELHAARPPRQARGLVLFFTGLSGAGKSTLARDVADALAERGGRAVSLLDGDQVRRLLSAGLTFSRADRDLNIARIGFVAAEIARHGGLAICAPIAPYAAARAQVREMVSQTGDFLLVHVATPLEACEARDRKGLYAKARAGAITGFTGISDPYEEPGDADLVIDTSVLTRAEAVRSVLHLLGSGGWLAEAALP